MWNLMIDQTSPSPETSAAAARPRKILRMVQNERMAGSVPLWETPAKTDRHKIETALGNARDPAAKAGAETLAYNAASAAQDQAVEQEFGFADLLDMVNPLQHIPVVGTLYRELTGDTIRPIGQIVGGAVFGGPLGAAGGLVNAIVREETGKDLTGNAMALMLEGRMPEYKKTGGSPEERLSAAVRSAPGKESAPELPGSLLALADLRAGPPRQDATTRLASGETITWSS